MRVEVWMESVCINDIRPSTRHRDSRVREHVHGVISVPPQSKARSKNRIRSARVRDRFQRSEPVNKIIHNISWMSSLTLTLTRLTPHAILLLLLIQRKARLDRHERRSTWFESRRDTAERLALAALFLVFPRAEDRFAPGGVCGERCAAVGLDGDDVRLEGERVDELDRYVGGRGRGDDDTELT